VNLPTLKREKPGSVPKAGSTPKPGNEAVPAVEPASELVSRRDRLIERMTIMQSELGGLFYEMAIRDHVRMEVLIAKAAALQEVDIELAELEGRLKEERADSATTGHPVAGHCPSCGAPHLPGAAYCSQCAHALEKG
jgi:hypothetical protein